jgi:PKD repeat protein
MALVAALIAVIALGVCASSASAIIVRLQNGSTVSYQPLRGAAPKTPLDTTFNNMDYNGGPVMPSNTAYLIFWSPSGFGAYGSGSPPQYVSGLEQYFKDLSHDSGGHQNTDSVSTQYNDLTGAFSRYSVKFGGAFLDTDPYPASQCPAVPPVTECLTDAQIQTELEKVAAADHLKRDLSHEFFLLTPPHVEGCFDSNPSDPSGPYGGCSAGESVNPVYCAYHQQTTVSPMMFYADDPYVTGNAGCDDGNHPNGASDGALEGGLSHEHNESITDPIPNDAWTNGAGTNHGMEIGDQCDGQMGTALGTAPDGAKYNQVINGHFYWYQEEWSNQGHTCLQRYTLSGTLPVAKFSATAGSGTVMAFNASASSASGGIADFSWQFNAVSGASTVEQTSPSITNTFPAAGAYSIGLAVFAHDGLSRGAGGIVTTGHSGFTPGFTFSPSNPTAGQKVTFTGLSNVSRKPVTTYFWDFGDGSVGSGATPTHTYATAGTYTVKVVLFSGIGSAYPGAGAAPVYRHAVVVG